MLWRRAMLGQITTQMATWWPSPVVTLASSQWSSRALCLRYWLFAISVNLILFNNSLTNYPVTYITIVVVYPIIRACRLVCQLALTQNWLLALTSQSRQMVQQWSPSSTKRNPYLRSARAALATTLQSLLQLKAQVVNQRLYYSLNKI